MSVDRLVPDYIGIDEKGLNQYFEKLKDANLIRDYKIIVCEFDKYEVNVEVIKPFPYIEFEYKI